MEKRTVDQKDLLFQRSTEQAQENPRARRKARRILYWIIPLAGVLLLSPYSRLLVYLLPLFAVLLSWTFLRLSPAYYASFVIWLWFLIPFIRRVIDFRIGGNSAAPVLLAPYLACCVPLYFILRSDRRLVDSGSAPLIYMSAAVFYGFIVGISNFPPAAVLQGLLTWVSPLCFAFFLYYNRTHFESIFCAFERTMILGTLIAGVYGIYQYFYLPKWDALWMENLGNSTFGVSKPMQVRVFSLMNAPQIFALFVAAGILLALRSKNRIRFVVVPIGGLSLAFSMARTAWVSLAVGVMYLTIKAKPSLRFQIFAVALLSLAVFGVALQDPVVARVVSQRVTTLSDVGHDDSFVVRGEGYVALFSSILDHPFGLGIGGQANGNDKVGKDQEVGRGGKFMLQNDSTLAAVVLSLGGAGTLLAGVSFLIFLLVVFRSEAVTGTPTEAIKILVLLLLSESLFDNVVNGPGGFLGWTVFGLFLSAAAFGRERDFRRHSEQIGEGLYA